MGADTERVGLTMTDGRFPANLIHDGSEEVVELFPNNIKGQVGMKKITGGFRFIAGDIISKQSFTQGNLDVGSASRFFYCAKASKAERNMGLEGLEEKSTGHRSNFRCKICGYQKSSGTPCKCENPEWEEIPLKPQMNNHPTVKPISLMRYLCRLVTPPNGIVLDPFMGSGSTGIATKIEGFGFIGIEKDEGYFKIAEARIARLM